MPHTLPQLEELLRCEQLCARIETLPQGILAKAFRGELVPQLPEGDDAREEDKLTFF